MRPRILTAVLLFCTFICVSQNITTRLFTKDDGLPDPYVYSVVQDQQGFLWVSTGKGIAKFDGQFFSPVATGLPADEIVYASEVQKKGDLWFGTFSGRLLHYDGKQFKTFSKSCKASISRIFSFEQNDDLVIQTVGAGIFIKHNEDLVQLAGSDAYQISDVIPYNDKTLIVSTDEGLFSVDLKTAAFTELKFPEGAVKHIRRLKKRRDTFIIFSAKGECYEAQLMNATELREKKMASLPFKDIKGFACVEEKNALYITTPDERLYLLNSVTGSLQLISDMDFMAGSTCFYEDTEANTWIGSAGKGLYRIAATPYELIDAAEPVFAITQDAQGNSYYGTASGILIYNNTGKFVKRLQSPGRGSFGRINALYATSEQLWIGTDENGLSVLSLPGLKELPVEFSNIPNISVNAISGKGTEISVTTNLDGVYNYSGNRLSSHFSVQNSLLHNNVYHSLIARNGMIYYATHNTSFNHSLGNQLYEIDTRPLGLISEFNHFAEDSKGTIAIATNGDGIYLMKDTTIRTFPEDEELDSKFCESVLYDNQDDLWILQRYHMFKYYTKENVLHEIKFGMPNREMFHPGSFYKNASGDLYFGLNNAVVHFPNQRAADKIPVPYLVKAIVQDSVLKADHSDFSSGSYHVVIEFSALGLRNSEGIRFKYKLEGRDEHWSELSALRRAEFSKLTEGNYIFKVIAVNSEGFSSPEMELYRFNIAAPFWKNPLTWVFVIILLAVLVIVIIRVRTSALIRAKVKLEEQVNEKTKELREEKELVEEKNRHIEEQNTEIKDSITYARRIQEALLPDRELLAARDKNLFIFYQPRDIVSGDFYWIADQNGLKIIVAADCTGHGVPGALMSMIGTTLLNKIILEKKITQPKAILKHLDREVKQALKQHSEDATRDGMDLCLCVLDPLAKKLTYAGAMRPLFFVINRQLTEYTPTKHAIGGFSYGEDKEFEETVIDVKEGGMFYLFSDGYADQFGGDKGKKLMLKNFKKILITISEMELDKQEENLKRVYNNWKGGLDQVDDVLVIGARI